MFIMPVYEYYCDDCHVEFEELLNSTEKVEYFEWHPCPQCHERAERIKVAKISFQFSGGPEAGSGVHGNSGSHDLDYPSMDKAIGRSADRKWSVYNDQKATRDKERRRLGTNSVSENNGKVSSVDPSVANTREKGWNLFNKAKKTSST
jgi:putative FmdB family regulatory protein